MDKELVKTAEKMPNSMVTGMERNITPVKMLTNEEDIQEDKQLAEDLEEMKLNDTTPFYFRKESIKKIRKLRMCKYYAHHMECKMMKENGKCDYLHNYTIRATHDILALNR